MNSMQEDPDKLLNKNPTVKFFECFPTKLDKNYCLFCSRVRQFQDVLYIVSYEITSFHFDEDQNVLNVNTRKLTNMIVRKKNRFGNDLKYTTVCGNTIKFWIKRKIC